ncbi:unnamed protein product [Soboliphyme baturini]|uniref:Transmembrane protein n=1 Tax=Soboliphyme baturini TaxID=241478 RepID=A0A183IKC3_9BILA|nr:unnamed protein product [Soboliphyme baturini]
MAAEGYLDSLNTWVPESDILAFKTAFYCTLFGVFTCVSFAALLSVYMLLRNFLKPILWAVMCGCALFPMKKGLSKILTSWLNGLKENNTPLLLGVVVAPLKIMDRCSSSLVDLVLKKSIMKLILACVLVRYLFAMLTYDAVLTMATWSWAFFDSIIDLGSSSWSIVLAALLGVGCVCCFLFARDFNKDLLRYTFLSTWFVAFCAFVKLFYPVHMLVAFVLIALLLVMKMDINLSFFSVPKSPTKSSTPPVNFSDYCMEMMLGVSIIMFVIKHPTLLVVFALLLFYGMLKRTVEETLQIIEITQGSVDLIATATVIVMLLVSASLLGAFLFVQLNNEIVHIITVMGSITQQNGKLSELVSNFLKMQGNESLADSVYLHSRTWLTAQSRNLAGKDDLEKADLIESHVKMLLDKLYMRFNSGSEAYPTKQDVAMPNFWKFLTSLNVMDMIQENLNLLSSVMQTAWLVIKVNMDIAFMCFSTMFTFIIDLGFDIVRFLLQIVIFLTCFCYLLAFSGNEFLPLEWALSLIPVIPAIQSNKYLLLKAVQRSVRKVFIITFKMATFYGFYLWFLYSLFDLTVSVIPTVSASVLAAVPFVAPYWACLPGVLELWLIKGNSILAIGLAVSSFVPSFIVDPYFYEELNGSHPYLTGLSIVGGLYWLGFEGAIFGPILLCCLFSLVNICRDVVANT